MKTFFVLAGLCIALTGQAQIEDSGWFNADGSVTAEIPSGGFSEGGAGFSGSPTVIAETITPEIEALARGLGHDPVRIFHYVHDHIRHVLYFGSKKGAHLTLLERSGNDFDQSSLLVALLRTAGFSPSYQFGFLRMPFDSADHRDVRHWLQLTVPNTNWTTTDSYFSQLLGVRGYPTYFNLNSIVSSNIGIQRVWVKLGIGGTNYLLDPAFKVSEPFTGLNLSTAMGLDTNALLSAAGGTSTADYVQNMSEPAARNKLRDYTTNLNAYLQSNHPNASVAEITGGWAVTPATNSWLSQSLIFPVFENGGQVPVMDWANLPTNLMSRLSITLAGTNYNWFMPTLRGERLSLTFDSSGVAEVWQDDTLLVQKATTGGIPITSVSLSVDHPHGSWNYANNSLNNLAFNDQTVTADYFRTNAAYVLAYAFEAGPAALRARQERLDFYRQQGLADTSRPVMNETLNVMGLGWLEQSELISALIAGQGGALHQHHHRLGRMAQESGRGHYIDMFMQVSGVVADSGRTPDDVRRKNRVFDLGAYFGSALEHGILEQSQPTNIVAASTMKMLQLANTNGVKVFMANFGNWTAGANVRSQLVNYTNALPDLDARISGGSVLLLPQDGKHTVAGTGTWKGYGAVARRDLGSTYGMTMLIDGGYNGGYPGPLNLPANPNFVGINSYNQSSIWDPNGAYAFDSFGADPVRMTDGSFQLDATDLSLGQAEPRGITFSRSYSSARRRQNTAGMAHGWTHHYVFNAAELSAPEAGLGRTTPAQMAAMLVATRAALELYDTNGGPKNWLLSTLIAKWGVDQIINNGVSVTLGNDTVQFIRQPDGTLTPPANCTMTLVKTNSAYHLFQRHGNTFKFNSGGKLTNIVDQYGQSLKLAYNASNWVTTVTDWKNRTLTLGYAGTPSRLTSITDSTGRTVSFGYATTYSAQGDLTSVTDAEGKTSTFIYDTNHQIIAAKDALSRMVTSNLYDGFGRVVTQYTEGDLAKQWRLYWSGFVNTEQDPTGASRRFYFDDQSRQVAVEDALGNMSRTVYDGQNHVVTTVSPMNEVTEFQFDGRHNLVRALDPLGFTNTFNFDAQDRLTSTVDARGNPSRFGYNAKFQVTGSTNGAGGWQTFVFSATDGTLTSRTDAGGTATHSYDSWGQVRSIVHPGGLGTELLLNDALGNVLTRTNARGFVTTLQYNARRELTNTVAPTNLTARVGYDAVGNVLTATDPRGFATTHFWSATRQPLGSIFPSTPQGSPATTNLYDARDGLAQAANPLQQAVRLTNDAAGRLASSTDPLQRTVRLGYDANGRRTHTTNAALEVITQRWTARGEAASLTDGAANTSVRGYDAAGNQIILTNRNGKRWQFQFDGASRVTNTITPLNRATLLTFDERGLVKTVREPSGDTVTNQYDARGRLTNMTDSVSALRSLYDSNNNHVAVFESGKSNVWTFDAYDRVSTYRDADGNVMQYRRDPNGNVTNLVYPGGKTVSYAFDSLNRVTNVTDWANRKTSFEYDLASQLKKIIRPNGTVRTVDYDAAGEATNIWEKTASGTPIAVSKLGWNAAGRIEREFAAPLPHAWTPPPRTMTYDDDNRLATFNGNSVTHDLDGNMTSGPLTNNVLTNHVFDARNRLLSAGGVSYGYDALNQRTALTNGTNVTRYVINPNAALSQVLLRVQNGVTNYYVHGAGLLYEANDTGNTKTYHYDYRGSTVALTDGSGNVTDRAEYSAYGTLTYRTGSTDTPFLYNGRYGVQTDPNGLLHMRARYYNPHLGRFVNADPSGFSGGLNFYAYADGNPVSLIDPFGLGAVGANPSPGWMERAIGGFFYAMEAWGQNDWRAQQAAYDHPTPAYQSLANMLPFAGNLFQGSVAAWNGDISMTERASGAMFNEGALTLLTLGASRVLGPAAAVERTAAGQVVQPTLTGTEAARAALGVGPYANPGAALTPGMVSALQQNLAAAQNSLSLAQRGLNVAGNAISAEQAAIQTATTQQRVNAINQILQSGVQAPRH